MCIVFSEYWPNIIYFIDGKISNSLVKVEEDMWYEWINKYFFFEWQMNEKMYVQFKDVKVMQFI